MTDWIECRRIGNVLQANLEYANVDHLCDAQLKLWQEAEAHGDKCHEILVELRARRKIRGNIPN